MSRKVIHARLHTIIHLPTVGQMGPAIDADSAKVKGAMEITKESDGILIKGKSPRGDSFEAFVPNGNIVCLQLAPETSEKNSKAPNPTK